MTTNIVPKVTKSKIKKNFWKYMYLYKYDDNNFRINNVHDN